MPSLKVLGGDELIRIFSALGFSVESHRGSHAKLRRVLPDGTNQTLTIPVHGELDKGTLRATFRQELKYVPEHELKSHFYAE